MLNFFHYLAFNCVGATGATGADGQTPGGGLGGMIIMMAVLFGGMYFLTIRPQKKQQKKDQEMREGTQVGDEITTIGGIMGRVVTVKDDALVIETGADRNKMKIARWAIQTNNTAVEKAKQEREAQRAAQESAAREKKEKKNKKED